MLDPIIEGFLNERKEGWLKKKIKNNTTDEEKAEFEQEASEKFSLAEWLPDAAKRAKQLSMVSHPSKFSHPSAKTTNIIAEGTTETDGLLRTGNVFAELDVFGNAAALDVYKFLSLKLQDGKTILKHLEKKSDFIREQLDVSSTSFPEIEQGLLAIKQDDGSAPKTSEKVKQVYFPVSSDNNYHLLSILTPSSIMYMLKERIQQMHFSEISKEARECRRGGKVHEKGFAEVFGLSLIGYGGTKPQNISVLNNQNGGVAYLLPSNPPTLFDRKIRPPRTDFFRESLWSKHFLDDFQELQKLLSADSNNVHIRRRRDRIIKIIIYQVVDRLWMIRYLDAGWSDSDNYKKLPQYQKIWLDQQYREVRYDDLSWFNEVEIKLARWFSRTCKNLPGNKALSLGDKELSHIQKVISECEGGLQ